MRGFTPFARFTKGIVTDHRNVVGALLEALNMVPLRGGEAWTGRNSLDGSRMSNVDAVASRLKPGVLCKADSVQVFDEDVYGGVVTFDLGTGGLFRMVAVSDGYAGALGLTYIPVDHNGATLTSAFPTVVYRNIAGAQMEGQIGMQYAQELWQPTYFYRGCKVLPSRWAGNLKGVERSTNGGSMLATGVVGQNTITIANAAMTANDAGMYLYINATTVKERQFRIVQVLSATTAIVDAPFGASFTSVGVSFARASWWSVMPGTFGGGWDGVYTPLTSFSYLNAGSVCAHAGVTIAAATVDNDGVYYPSRVRNSYADADISGQWKGAERWHPNAYIDVEPGVGGSGASGEDGIMSVVSNGTDLLVFKSTMVWAIRGALSPDGTDLGARVDRVLETDGLWHGSPVSTPQGVVFIGQHGVYRIGQGTIENLTERSGVTRLFHDVDPISVGYADGRLWLIAQGTRAQQVANDLPSVMVYDIAFGIWYTMQTFLMLPPIDSWQGAYTVIGENELGAGEIAFLSARDDDETDGYDDSYVDAAGVVHTVFSPSRLVTHTMPLKGEVNGRLRAVQMRGQFRADNPLVSGALDVRAYVGEEGEEATPVSAAVAQDPNGSVLGGGWRRAPIRGGCPPTSVVRVVAEQVGSMERFRVEELGVEHVSVARTR